jgi:outer membrane lipoprotein-sorting protein
MLIGPDGSVEKLNVVGRDQSLLSYNFTDEKINPPLSDSLFHFQIPPGAKVVNAVDYRGQEK